MIKCMQKKSHAIELYKMFSILIIFKKLNVSSLGFETMFNKSKCLKLRKKTCLKSANV
mgnify:CR=1 FL=1